MQNEESLLYPKLRLYQKMCLHNIIKVYKGVIARRRNTAGETQ